MDFIVALSKFDNPELLLKNETFQQAYYDAKPYCYRVQQRYRLYNTGIWVLAFGMSALVLRKRKGE